MGWNNEVGLVLVAMASRGQASPPFLQASSSPSCFNSFVFLPPSPSSRNASLSTRSFRARCLASISGGIGHVHLRSNFRYNFGQRTVHFSQPSTFADEPTSNVESIEHFQHGPGRTGTKPSRDNHNLACSRMDCVPEFVHVRRHPPHCFVTS